MHQWRRVRERGHGLRERGAPGDGPWRWDRGTGYVAAVEGDYHRAVEVHGCDVTLMLVGVLGGFGPELVGLVKRLTEERANRMTRSEYDQTTWAARSWRSFSVQKIAVAAQRAAALEIAYALGLSTAGDERSGA